MRRLAAIASVWNLVTRVGEARNPGPRAEARAVVGQGAVKYRKPLVPGFRDVRCCGFEGGVPGEAPRDEAYQLRIVTVNATTWKAATRFLERTSADVVLVQESRVMAKHVPRHSAAALRRGWQTLWTPAQKGPKGHPSGGAVVCARAPVALSRPPRGPSEVVPGRVVAGMIEPPACRPTVVYAGYLKDGVGANEENLRYLANIGAHCGIQPRGMQVVVGCDFNFTPQTLVETGFPDEVGGVVVSPGGDQTTCRTGKTARVIDFFVVSKSLAKGAESVKVLEATGIKTHVPVELSFHPRLTSLKALALRKPPSLGVERVYGPREAPPSWSRLAAKCEKLAAAALKGGRAAVDRDFQRAYEEWADLAEVELQQITGDVAPKLGLRGRRPRLYWRSVLPEKVEPRSSDVVVALRSLANVLLEMQRYADAVSGGMDASGGDGDVHRLVEKPKGDLDLIERRFPVDGISRLCNCARQLLDDGRTVAMRDGCGSGLTSCNDLGAGSAAAVVAADGVRTCRNPEAGDGDTDADQHGGLFGAGWWP